MDEKEIVRMTKMTSGINKIMCPPPHPKMIKNEKYLNIISMKYKLKEKEKEKEKI